MVLSRNYVFVTLLVLLKFNGGSGNKDEDECKRCVIENISSLICKGLNVSDGDFLSFQCLSISDKDHIKTIVIQNSTIATFSFDFVETDSFSQLISINITGSNVSSVIGSIPCGISSLSLQNNTIRNFSAELLLPEIHATTISYNPSTGHDLGFSCGHKSLSLDLRNNSVEELPLNFVSSARLKSLHLSGNPLKCEFIWENVWDHLNCQNRSTECKNLFVDRNSTTCQFYRQLQEPVQSGLFLYNLAQIFDSKITLENECSEMNKTCDCHPYNLRREQEGRNTTVYLAVNCFGKNFTELPTISEYTWELNVSHNHIQNLEKLNHSMYRNLRILDLSNNFVTDLSDLTTTSFISRFDWLYINSNTFRQIPNAFFDSIKGSSGKGTVKIGGSLECDCKSAGETKVLSDGRMIELKDKIADLNDVVCGNLIRREDPDEDANLTGGFMRLSDLKIQDMCPMNDPQSEAFNWMVLIIIVEVLCIAAVILKVFYDWREYQRTGILPWIAKKLPRLPCDGILEY